MASARVSDGWRTIKILIRQICGQGGLSQEALKSLCFILAGMKIPLTWQRNCRNAKALLKKQLPFCPNASASTSVKLQGFSLSAFKRTVWKVFEGWILMWPQNQVYFLSRQNKQTMITIVAINKEDWSRVCEGGPWVDHAVVWGSKLCSNDMNGALIPSHSYYMWSFAPPLRARFKELSSRRSPRWEWK